MREERLNRLKFRILQELSELVRSVKDPRVGKITLTRVELNKDASLATIGYVSLGEETENLDVKEGLTSATPYLRHHLGKRLETRILPDLIFKWDQGINHAFSIQNILNKIKE